MIFPCFRTSTKSSLLANVHFPVKWSPWLFNEGVRLFSVVGGIGTYQHSYAHWFNFTPIRHTVSLSREQFYTGNKPQHILFLPKQPLGLMLIKRLPFEDKWSLNLSRLQHLLGQDSFYLAETENLSRIIISSLTILLVHTITNLSLMCPSGSPWTLSFTATNQPCWQSLVGRRSTLRTLGKVTPPSCSWKAQWMGQSNRMTPNSCSHPSRSMAPPCCLPGICSFFLHCWHKAKFKLFIDCENKLFWDINCLEFAKITEIKCKCHFRQSLLVFFFFFVKNTLFCIHKIKALHRRPWSTLSASFWYVFTKFMLFCSSFSAYWLLVSYKSTVLVRLRVLLKH